MAPMAFHFWSDPSCEIAFRSSIATNESRLPNAMASTASKTFGNRAQPSRAVCAKTARPAASPMPETNPIAVRGFANRTSTATKTA
jgi:hypothetical protein